MELAKKRKLISVQEYMKNLSEHDQFIFEYIIVDPTLNQKIRFVLNEAIYPKPSIEHLFVDVSTLTPEPTQRVLYFIYKTENYTIKARSKNLDYWIEWKKSQFLSGNAEQDIRERFRQVVGFRLKEEDGSNVKLFNVKGVQGKNAAVYGIVRAPSHRGWMMGRFGSASVFITETVTAFHLEQNIAKQYVQQKGVST